MRCTARPSSRRIAFPLRAVLFGLLSFLITSAHGRLVKRDEVNYCINPPAAGPSEDFSDNISFTVGSVVDIGWVTDYPSVALQLCQQGPDSTAACYPLFRNQVSVTSVQWTVGLGGSGFILSDGQVFYFQVFNGNLDSEDTFTCHYFNIVENGKQTTQSVVTATMNPGAVAASSSSVEPFVQTVTMTPKITLQAAVVSATPSSSVSFTSTTKGSTQSPSITSEPSSSGLSQSAKVGIGVGVGVGVVCLAVGLLIGFCLWRRGKQKSAQTQDAQQQQQDPFLPAVYQASSGETQSAFSADPKYAPMQQYGYHGGELPVTERPAEMAHGGSPTQELPGSQPFQAYRPGAT
ncbi:uncharacterized protein LTR77_009871 [Saxophila tyrrhenica]|uniref:Uncharacterized protein n=1 Tax=Saxophila tyrrhenica TaxID=1690608 RepID=A0AAV9NY24_9PEZI|nr:hypothetical protein LTR77_009871 [Saxophila tyrrhenica]